MAIIIGGTSAGSLGTVTLGEVKSHIQAEGYDNDTSAQQTLMVRGVLRALYGERRWPWVAQQSTAYSATVANQGIIDISALGRGIHLEAVRWSLGTAYYGDGDLQYVSNVAIRDYRHVDRTAGTPRKWGRIADSILVYPIPDNTYPLVIDYDALTTLPTADGDSIQWPETHIDVIIYGAIMRLCRRQRDWNGFDRAKASYEDALRRLFRDIAVVEEQTDLRVERWAGWDYLS